MSAPTNPFLSVFLDCMQASPDDQYMIIMDESTQPLLTQIDEALSSLSLKGINILIPIAAQKRVCDLSKTNGYNVDSHLPRAFRQALFESTLILNITSGDSSLAAFRRSIVHQSRHPEARFAHVPGISEAVLASVAASPIDSILGYCELFAWLIGNSNEATLLTYDDRDTCYRLQMTLGGWSNEPMMSPGRILKGSWGNIPPGETFTCPEAGTAHGEVCLNGSGLGMTVSTGHEVILTFRDGRLAGWANRGNEELSSRFDTLNAAAAADLDSNWKCVAELGIGLNPAVRLLSGNPLFDEKALGTVHVAIGDNSGFGRGIASRRHNDLVIRAPTLVLDGREVIHRGTIDMQSLQSLRAGFMPPKAAFDKQAGIRLKEADISLNSDGVWRRLSSEGRTNYVRIAGLDDIPFYAVSSELVKCTTELRDVSAHDLTLMTGLSDGAIAEMLSRLVHYDIIDFYE